MSSDKIAERLANSLSNGILHSALLVLLQSAFWYLAVFKFANSLYDDNHLVAVTLAGCLSLVWVGCNAYIQPLVLPKKMRNTPDEEVALWLAALSSFVTAILAFIAGYVELHFLFKKDFIFVYFIISAAVIKAVEIIFLTCYYHCQKTKCPTQNCSTPEKA